jgi:hypothetical protein
LEIRDWQARIQPVQMLQAQILQMQTLQTRIPTLDWWHPPRSLAVSDMQLLTGITAMLLRACLTCCSERPDSVLLAAADRAQHTACTHCLLS